MELSRRISGISPSLTLAIDAKAKSMAQQGIDVIGFGAGEPDFGAPRHVIEASIEALEKGMTRYTAAEGSLELRKAIAEKFLRDNALSYTPAQILVSNGAKHSLYNAFQALLDPGDEALMPAPYWLSYPEMIRMADGVPVFVEAAADNAFKVTAQQVEEAVTPKTKLLVLNSPCNPTGAVYTQEEMRAIADVAIRRNLFVVSDEIYEDYLYDGAACVSIASLGDDIFARTLVVNGVSKAYAMTGLRIGYAAGPEKLIKAMGAMQSHATSNPNSVAQHATIAALAGGKEELVRHITAFDARRRYIINCIQAIPGLSCIVPKGAFYIMMDVRGVLGKTWQGKVIDGCVAFAACLLEAEKVAVVPGAAFGVDGYERLSFATSMEKIEKGMARIASFVAALQ